MSVRKKMEEAYNDEWDFMISYEWRTGLKYADKLFTELKKSGYTVWLDRNEMKGNIFDKMANAVLKSKVIILLISEAYEKSENCKKEYNYANQLNKLIIPVKVEKYNPVEGRALDLLIAGEMYYSLYKDFDSEVKLMLTAIPDKLKQHTNKISTNLGKNFRKNCTLVFHFLSTFLNRYIYTSQT